MNAFIWFLFFGSVNAWIATTKTFSFRSSMLSMKDYPKPNVENTDNYRESTKLSEKFKTLKKSGVSKFYP